MSNPIIFDGHEHREMTDKEHEQYLSDQKQAAANIEAENAKAAARAAAIAKLGLTADEISALFG